jgi:hypothetical protein
VVGAILTVGARLTKVLHNAYNDIRKQPRRARGTLLVGHDAELIPLSRELKHGIQEVNAMAAKDPAVSNDDMFSRHLADGVLAQPLGLADQDTIDFCNQGSSKSIYKVTTFF